MKKHEKSARRKERPPVIKFHGGHVQIVNPRHPIENVWSDILHLKSGAEFPAHSHKATSSLLICVDGSGEVGINGKTIRLRKGVCAFIPAGAEHYVKARRASSLTCLSINEGIIKPGAGVDMDFTNPRVTEDSRLWSEFAANCAEAAAGFQRKRKDGGHLWDVFSLSL